jgi:hypothetical protein
VRDLYTIDFEPRLSVDSLAVLMVPGVPIALCGASHLPDGQRLAVTYSNHA